jgi:dTDP-4-dehydrorhamnose reductase
LEGIKDSLDVVNDRLFVTGADPGRVRPTTNEAFARPVPHPTYSVLGHERRRAAGIAPIRDWRDALAEALWALVEAERAEAPRRK